nr:hypothetical protein [Chryseolinea sp.]
MPEVLKTSLRIARFVGKLILGLLIILISAVAIVHLPPVQRQITRSLSNYLSSKIEAKVYIERVEFSIFGQVIIQGLTVWNRHEVKLFSIQKIEVNSSLYDLVTGDLIFDEILIVGLTGKLSEDENGLNIQFILDAFQSAEKESTTAESTVVKLQFKNVQLENIDFEFESIPSGISVANIIGILTIQNAELSTYPLILTADNVALQRSTVNILSNTVAETSNDNSISKPDSIDIDTRAGIRIHVAGLHIKDSDFSFHQDAIVHTPKFDPGHIDLKNIQIGLSDIFVGVKKDTVAAILQSLSVQLPGFKVDEARADLHWSQNYLAASGLHFASNTNSLHADFASRYELQSDKDFDHAHVTIDASGTINPTDLSYFISDSILNNVKHWSSASLTLEGQYHLGEGEIKTFNVQTGNSQLHVAGKMGDVTNLEKLYWNDLTINTTIGSDFKQTLNPHLRTINLPADVAVNIRSSGNLKGSSVDGNVSSDWGNVKLNGVAGQQAEDFKINMDLIADQIDLGKWMNVSSIGPVTLTANANGLIGDHTNVEIKGLINDIKLMDENIHSIDFQSTVEKSNALVNLQIADPKYKSEIHSEIQFAGPLMLTTNATVTDFQVGDLLQMDSTLSISGNLKSKVTIESSSIEGYVAGDTLIFQNHSTRYALDSLNLHTLLSPTVTEFEYYSDNEKANLTANFDIQKSLEEIQSRLIHIWKGNSIPVRSIGNKKLEFNIALDKAKLLQLLGLKVEDFSSLNIEGEWDEQKKSTLLHVATGNFKAYGVSLDSLNSNLTVLKDSLSALLNAKNLVYNSIALGNVDFDILSKGDTAVSNFLLMNDTITVLGLRTRILPTDSGTFVFPDQVMALDHDYSIDRSNPVYFDSKNIVLDNFQVSREDMHIKVDGDINKFDASLQHVDLIPLNLILSSNTTVISK